MGFVFHDNSERSHLGCQSHKRRVNVSSNTFIQLLKLSAARIVFYIKPHPSVLKQKKTNQEMFADDTHFSMLTLCIILSTPAGWY